MRLLLLTLAVVLLIDAALFTGTIPHLNLFAKHPALAEVSEGNSGVVVVPQEPTNIPSIEDTASTTPAASVPENTALTQATATEKLPAVVVPAPQPVTSTYIEIHDSCGPYFSGVCARVRSGPGTTSPVVARVRNGVVLKTDGTREADGHTWYKVIFDEWVRYPERVTGDWYIASDFALPIIATSEFSSAATPHASSTKTIVVNRTEQMLYAYEGSTLFMKESISTGLDLTPTPRGVFAIYKKTPSRYMQGPLPGVSDQYYDLPGVPWNLYFTNEGGAIHGSFWHNNFGQQWSHGCVNLPVDKAHELYLWADIGTPVTVHD